MSCMLRALTAGLVVAIIVIEAMLAGVQLFTVGEHPHAVLAAGEILPMDAMLVTTAIWLIGGALAGAMGTAVSGWRPVGWFTGGLLTMPLMVILLLAGTPWAVVGLAAAPLAGGIAGAALAVRTRAA